MIYIPAVHEKKGLRLPIRVLAVTLFIFLGTLSLFGQNNHVEVFAEEDENGGFRFYAENTHIIPVTLRVEFRELINLTPSVPLPHIRVLDPDSGAVLLFTLSPGAARGRRGYSISYSWARGDPEQVFHDDEYRYLLPYAHGTKHRVTQGYRGSFTHHGENEYALDFDMDIGTPVHAARSGTVVEVKTDSNIGGPDPRFSAHANYILIRHDDGTFGNYVHLKQNGAVVRPGNRVNSGDHIGYSGNTGRSSGPHLHFDVRRPTQYGTMVSIPTLFVNHTGEPIRLEENGFYYARHPGGPEFETVFGSDLTNEQFESHHRETRRNERIEFRTEELDLTHILYLQNGFSEPMEIEIEIRLRGMSASRELPRRMIVPARSERFVVLLFADPDARSWQYAPRIRYWPAE